MGTTSLVNISEAAVNLKNSQSIKYSQSIRRDSPNKNKVVVHKVQPQYNKKPVIVVQQHKKPAPVRPTYSRYRRPVVHREKESHSDTGNLVTGLIIGGILGAVIANNA